METIDIARRLAALEQAEQAQNAYKLVIHQGHAPEEQLEAALYILQSGGDYKVSYTCLRELYNQGHFRDQVLSLMIGAFYEPNIQELRSRYERNCKLLKKYPYCFREDFLPFDELPVWFFPYDDDGYVPFYPDQQRFGEYINFKNPVVSRNFFHDLEKPILADDVYSQYELEYLNDIVRRSEDIGRENHVYLHYAAWPVFCAHLQCLNLPGLLKEQKLVFLIEEEIRRYPIDFLAEYGVDYSRCPVRPVRIQECKRLIWHTQLSYHNGGDFFNEIFDYHPNLLVLPSLLMSDTEAEVKKHREAMDSAKSLRHALEIFKQWKYPQHVEELYRMKRRTSKDMMVALYLENEVATVALDPASRIVPAVFFQPHFEHMPAELSVNEETGETVLDMTSYSEFKDSPLLLGFKYVKTFTPMRRFTTSHGATLRFMYFNTLTSEKEFEKDTSRKLAVINDAILDRVLNRSFLVDPEDRLFKDSVVVRFEDGKLNPRATFTALSKFLDLPYTDSMTRCTQNGREAGDVAFAVGNAIGFDTDVVFRTYDDFINDSERYYIEYLLRDAYEYYGYAFQYYDGAPVDEARAEELIRGFTTLEHYMRATWKVVIDRTDLYVEGMPDGEEKDAILRTARDKLLDSQMQKYYDNHIRSMKILLKGLRFVSKNGQPLQMIRKLELDPALLDQPLYH